MPDYDPTNAGNKPGEGPLRAGGRAPEAGTPIAEDRDLPSTPSKAAKRQKYALSMVRDLYNGTEEVKRKGTTYLPKNLGEDPTNYQNRLTRAHFFNAFRRTVEGLAGLVFSTDPVLGEDVPEPIKEHWENIDAEGTHGDVFLRDLFSDALTTGHAAILIEYPDTSEIPASEGRRPEMEGRVRPYWVPILKDNIISWRRVKIDGRMVLTQVVLREIVCEPDGEFGELERTQYRVLERTATGVGYRVLEVTKDRMVRELSQGTYPTQDEIPLVEVPTSGRRSLFDSDPPLLDVAYLNIAHYQQQSDWDWSKHKTCTPVFVIAGLEPPTDDAGNPTPVKLGANDALVMANPQAKATYEAHDGSSLDSVRQGLEDLKSDMGTLGLAMLSPQKRTAETAEAKRLDKSTSDSALAVAARALQDSSERGLGIHAKYMGLESGGSITINRDFEQLALDARIMAAYAQLINAGLPIDVVLEMLQRGGRLPDETDIEELAVRMAAEQVAIEQDREEQRQAQLEQMTA